MKNNHYLMAARGVAKILTEEGVETFVKEDKPKLLSNMLSFEMESKNIEEGFFSVTLPKVLKEITKKTKFEIKYATFSIKGNGYWRVYLILDEQVNDVKEILKEEKQNLSTSDKLKELYLSVNNLMINQKTRRKSCRDCDSVINLDKFFGSQKFKYKKKDEAVACPVCGSLEGFYSRTVRDKISKLK